MVAEFRFICWDDIGPICLSSCRKANKIIGKTKKEMKRSPIRVIGQKTIQAVEWQLYNNSCENLEIAEIVKCFKERFMKKRQFNIVEIFEMIFKENQLL